VGETLKYLGLTWNRNQDTILINKEWRPRSSCSDELLRGIVWKGYSGKTKKWKWTILPGSYMMLNSPKFLSFRNMDNWYNTIIDIFFQIFFNRQRRFFTRWLWSFDIQRESTSSCEYLLTTMYKEKWLSRQRNNYITKYERENERWFLDTQFISNRMSIQMDLAYPKDKLRCLRDLKTRSDLFKKFYWIEDPFLDKYHFEKGYSEYETTFRRNSKHRRPRRQESQKQWNPAPALPRIKASLELEVELTKGL
jgi:hypothetical protein